MKKVLQSNERAEYRFGSWLKQAIDQIAPKNLYLYIGRGGAKTTDILAERAMDVSYDMPGARFALVADTYLNAMKNVVPSLLEGWERKGWAEGIHYVVNKRPPSFFKKPYKPVETFDHIISLWNGCVFKIVSMDRPSTAAGDSFQHIFGDEAKYLKKEKLNKLTPAIRGEYVRYGHSPFYRGQTFTSDMANPLQGEDDWMHNLAKKMDVGQIVKILQVANVLNEIRIELIEAEEKEPKNKALHARIEKKLNKWLERYRKVRKGSTFFYIASSYINADLLTEDFFLESFTDLGDTEFYTSVLSIRPTLEKGARFYQLLGPQHYFTDGILYSYYDTFKLGDQIAETCKGLKYLDLNKPLEAGADFGNMMSMVFGQPQGENYRVLKTLYTVTPEWIEDLAAKFITFFEPHNLKVLDLYYDRAGNQYSKAGKDFVTQLKTAIEEKDGRKTGWLVRLKSQSQGNITHVQEFDLMMQLFGTSNPHLPNMHIDMYNCRELKSSLEHTPVIVKEIAGKRTIKKDKSSEKELPLHRLPMESTNFSDAFKYLMCRPEYLTAANPNQKPKFSSVSIRG